MLQEMAVKHSTYESGSLALKYKLDNEFELVFIAAYQKMLPLSYLDKLLDEIQLRFRDRFFKDLKVSSSHALTTLTDTTLMRCVRYFSGIKFFSLLRLHVRF